MQTVDEAFFQEPEKFNLAVVSDRTVFLVKHLYTGKKNIADIYTDIISRKMDDIQ